MTNPLQLSAIELAHRIRTGKITASEVLETHISRILRVNEHLNAMVAKRFDAARDEAAAADERIALAKPTDELPPLLGVPCTMKEFISVEGQPHTGGLMARQSVVASQDAVVVQRIKDAGAIIMGSSNGPEGGLWMETYNTVYGWTLNPWGRQYSPGGSSGGEGALLSAGATPFGLGSDVGGSIRIPAAFCGVVGHKPTGGMVPTHGHQPPGHVGEYLVVGPMTRYVRDLYPLLKIIAGPHELDPHVRDIALGNPADVDLSKCTVYAVECPPRVRTRPQVRQTIRTAAASLTSRGASVKSLHLPALKYAADIWAAMLQEAEEQTYDEILGGGQKIRPGWELIKWPFGGSVHTFPALFTAFVQRFAFILAKRDARMVALGKTLQRELSDTLGETGILLYPPYTRGAPKHHGALFTPLDFVCTAIFNVMLNPSTQVPLGFDSRGLPLGVQVVASPGRDALCMAGAEAIEADHGGWTMSMQDV